MAADYFNSIQYYLFETLFGIFLVKLTTPLIAIQHFTFSIEILQRGPIFYKGVTPQSGPFM